MTTGSAVGRAPAGRLGSGRPLGVFGWRRDTPTNCRALEFTTEPGGCGGSEGVLINFRLLETEVLVLVENGRNAERLTPGPVKRTSNAYWGRLNAYKVTSDSSNVTSNAFTRRLNAYKVTSNASNGRLNAYKVKSNAYGMTLKAFKVTSSAFNGTLNEYKLISNPFKVTLNAYRVTPNAFNLR